MECMGYREKNNPSSKLDIESHKKLFRIQPVSLIPGVIYKAMNMHACTRARAHTHTYIYYLNWESNSLVTVGNKLWFINFMTHRHPYIYICLCYLQPLGALSYLIWESYSMVKVGNMFWFINFMMYHLP